MAKNKPRYVESDLQGRTETQVSPQAHAVDSFFLARPARFNPIDSDFSPLSETLTKFATLAIAKHGQSEQQAGQADTLLRIQQLTAETGSTAAAFAKLVHSGALAEEHSPYYRTGQRRAVARLVAASDYAAAVASIDSETGAFTAGSASGIPPTQPEQGAVGFDKIRKDALEELRKTNPEIVEDPWFRNEYAAASATNIENLLGYEAKVRSAAANASARHTYSRELTSLLEVYSGTDFNAPDRAAKLSMVQDYMTKLHSVGLKNPHDFLMETAAGIAGSTIAADPRDPELRAKAFQALSAVGDVTVGGVALNEGALSDRFYQTLAHYARSDADDSAAARKESQQVADAVHGLFAAPAMDESLKLPIGVDRLAAGSEALNAWLVENGEDYTPAQRTAIKTKTLAMLRNTSDAYGAIGADAAKAAASYINAGNLASAAVQMSYADPASLPALNAAFAEVKKFLENPSVNTATKAASEAVTRGLDAKVHSASLLNRDASSDIQDAFAARLEGVRSRAISAMRDSPEAPVAAYEAVLKSGYAEAASETNAALDRLISGDTAAFTSAAALLTSGVDPTLDSGLQALMAENPGLGGRVLGLRAKTPWLMEADAYARPLSNANALATEALTVDATASISQTLNTFVDVAEATYANDLLVVSSKAKPTNALTMAGPIEFYALSPAGKELVDLFSAKFRTWMDEGIRSPDGLKASANGTWNAFIQDLNLTNQKRALEGVEKAAKAGYFGAFLHLNDKTPAELESFAKATAVRKVPQVVSGEGALTNPAAAAWTLSEISNAGADIVASGLQDGESGTSKRAEMRDELISDALSTWTWGSQWLRNKAVTDVRQSLAKPNPTLEVSTVSDAVLFEALSDFDSGFDKSFGGRIKLFGSSSPAGMTIPRPKILNQVLEETLPTGPVPNPITMSAIAAASLRGGKANANSFVKIADRVTAIVLPELTSRFAAASPEEKQDIQDVFFKMAQPYGFIPIEGIVAGRIDIGSRNSAAKPLFSIPLVNGALIPKETTRFWRTRADAEAAFAAVEGATGENFAPEASMRSLMSVMGLGFDPRLHLAQQSSYKLLCQYQHVLFDILPVTPSEH